MAHFHVFNIDSVTTLAIPDKINPSLHVHSLGDFITSANADAPGHTHSVLGQATGPDLSINIDIGEQDLPREDNG